VEVRVVRVYDRPGPEAGVRVLVDRLWPRGVAKEEAPWDHWLPEVAPSSELRQWFGHDPAKFPLFEKQYLAELASPKGQAALARLRALAGDRPLVLVTASSDREHNQAVVLRRLLLGEVAPPR
jgi:uncharacterized protein YeaO (DUF488 family)